jgi:Protein of unknown function (DUF2889)
MPLSPAAPRKRLHERNARYEGFARDDGLFDVEAHLTDVKDQDQTLLSGVRRAGEPVHDMWVRLTIDRSFTIHAIEAKTDAMPYPGGCNLIEDAYRRLIGANLLEGFRKTLHDAFGGIRGCTHLTELLGYLPTAAVQTFAGLKKREDEGEEKPFQLDRCHALDTRSDVVRRYYPTWYRGAA